MKQLFLFTSLAIIITAILTAVYVFSEPRKQAQLSQKRALLAESMLTNAKISKVQDFELLAPAYLHMADPQSAQRLYSKEKPLAVIITVLTDHAYAGRIALLVGIDVECAITSVEVLNSQETPGLGDQYKKDSGAWLKAFRDKTFNNANWKLKKQGGDFDAWTGATVTPKAIVAALPRTLKLCEDHHDDLFSTREVVYID